MFTDPVQFHVQKPTGDLESNGDVSTAVTRATLVLDSLTPDLARELSAEIEDLCFTDGGRIRDEISNLEVRLREPQQCVTVKMALDVSAHIVLRHVRIPSVKFTKRGEDPNEEVERKSKKVAPTGETLRARFTALILPENDATCRFLLQMAPGKTFFFEFEDEAKQLDFGPAEGHDDDDDQQPALGFERPAKLKRAAKIAPITDAQVLGALDAVSVGLTPRHLKALTEGHRAEILVWRSNYDTAREHNAAELPAPPSFILHPEELPALDPVEPTKPKKAVRAETPAKRDNHWKAKRQAKHFTNPPRVAKATKKGRK